MRVLWGRVVGVTVVSVLVGGFVYVALWTASEGWF